MRRRRPDGTQPGSSCEPRPSQVASSAVDSSGSAPGRPCTSASTASTNCGSTVSPSASRGALDDLAELRRCHWWDEQGVGADRGGELHVLGHTADEVGSHAHDERRVVLIRDADELVARTPPARRRCPPRSTPPRAGRRRSPADRSLRGRPHGGGRRRPMQGQPSPSYSFPLPTTHPFTSAGSNPACTNDDFPLPRCTPRRSRVVRSRLDEFGQELVSPEEEVGRLGIERFEPTVRHRRRRNARGLQRELDLALLDEPLQAFDPVGKISTAVAVRRTARLRSHAPRRRAPLARVALCAHSLATWCTESGTPLVTATSSSISWSLHRAR